MWRCTANRSRCRHQRRLFSFPGLKAAKFSAPVALGNAVTAKSFTSGPGHEAYPIYYDKSVRLVLRNAVRWAMGDGMKWIDSCPLIDVEDAPEKITMKGPSIHKKGEAGLR